MNKRKKICLLTISVVALMGMVIMPISSISVAGSGDCGRVDDYAARKACNGDCSSIESYQIRKACEGDCSSIESYQLNKACKGDCSSIQDYSARKACESCGGGTWWVTMRECWVTLLHVNKVI